jgi:hypothetical protein
VAEERGITGEDLFTPHSIPGQNLQRTRQVLPISVQSVRASAVQHGKNSLFPVKSGGQPLIFAIHSMIRVFMRDVGVFCLILI